ncbi:YceI family protein [Pseudotamlana carrageenivorans]|uniref:YceI family protein n=1 Tax=Pseudotamlana carrageenivorans TaxID=2069432 RepID=A0A2I7SKP2_9FLAO|nr:YceI family protein [Tamlana carrageenivorans]AUS06440.1 YceI family protein [Tamlana carrageenivorans]
MEKQKRKTKGLLSFLALLFVSINLIQAQELKLVNSESILKIYGTSSIHDWHEEAESQSGKLVFSDLENGKIEALSVAIETESLKSGKSGMDKNTYKALNSKKHKQITFQLTKVESVSAKGNGVFDVKIVGDLTIAGTKKSIALNFKLVGNGGKATIEGEKKIKMTQFNVEPPTAMLGAITTGDDLTIKFKTTFK